MPSWVARCKWLYVWRRLRGMFSHDQICIFVQLELGRFCKRNISGFLRYDSHSLVTNESPRHEGLDPERLVIRSSKRSRDKPHLSDSNIDDNPEIRTQLQLDKQYVLPRYPISAVRLHGLCLDGLDPDRRGALC